jgi:hypothetical protein
MMAVTVNCNETAAREVKLLHYRVFNINRTASIEREFKSLMSLRPHV